MARVTHPGGGESKVKQSEAERANVNSILRRYVANGTPLPRTGQEPRYGDFSGMEDFHSALVRIRAAEADFEALPAKVRREAANDPGEFLRMVQDPEEVQRLVKAGLEVERVPPTLAEQVAEAIRVVQTPPEGEGESSEASE